MGIKSKRPKIYDGRSLKASIADLAAYTQDLSARVDGISDLVLLIYDRLETILHGKKEANTQDKGETQKDIVS